MCVLYAGDECQSTCSLEGPPPLVAFLSSGGGGGLKRIRRRCALCDKAKPRAFEIDPSLLVPARMYKGKGGRSNGEKNRSGQRKKDEDEGDGRRK